MTEPATQGIHAALIGAMRQICKLGISKTSKGVGYNYRGIDAAMNEMSPILVNNGITVTPRYSELTLTKYERDGGKFSHAVTLKGSFTFAAADGSSVVAEAYGESIDTSDKATIKAQTVAFRTVLFQQFIVPLMAMDTELDDAGESSDADALMLTAFRDAALSGTKALQKQFEKAKPPASFWARNSPSLKAAAAEADKANAKPAKSDGPQL